MGQKSIIEKLLIKDAASVWISSPLAADVIGSLPVTVHRVPDPAEAAAVLVVADGAAAVRSALARYRDAFARADVFWVAYPKGNRADINRDTLWPILAEHAMRPMGQIALNEVWSAMRFRADRPGEARFAGGAKG